MSEGVGVHDSQTNMSSGDDTRGDRPGDPGEGSGFRGGLGDRNRRRRRGRRGRREPQREMAGNPAEGQPGGEDLLEEPTEVEGEENDADGDSQDGLDLGADSLDQDAQGRKKRRRRKRGGKDDEAAGEGVGRKARLPVDDSLLDLGLSLGDLGGFSAEVLRRMASFGLRTAGDLLFHLPLDYSDRRRSPTAWSAIPGASATLTGKVLRRSVVLHRRRGSRVVTAQLADDVSTFVVRWNHLKGGLLAGLTRGDSYHVTGQLTEDRAGLVISDPQVEATATDRVVHRAGIVPLYRCPEVLTQPEMRELVYRVLLRYRRRLPVLDVGGNKLSLEELLWALHFPAHDADLNQLKSPEGQERQLLMRAEFFLYGMALALRRELSEEESPGSLHIKHEYVSRVVRDLPFPLTDDQSHALEDVKRDLMGKRPMYRLLHAALGTGADSVALLASLIVVENSQQVVVLTPNDQVAERQFRVIERVVSPYGVRLELMTSQVRGRPRERLLQRLRKGEVDIVVGTQAIFQEGVQLRRLGLVVVDEHDQLGGVPRRLMARRGLRPHLLVLASIPVPTALLYTQYADLQVSRLTQLVGQHDQHETHVIAARHIDEGYAIFVESLGYRGVGHVIYPAAAEGLAPTIVERLVTAGLEREHIGVVSPETTSTERESMLFQLQQHRLRVLVVADTQVEVLDGLGQSSQLVEGAETFPLLTVYRWRMMVDRGTSASCQVLTLSPTATAADHTRLAPLEEDIDGFHLADEDLRVRGVRAFLGTRRPWMPNFRLGDLVKDVDVLGDSMEAARTWESHNPQWARSAEHRWLVSTLQARWSELLNPGGEPAKSTSRRQPQERGPPWLRGYTGTAWIYSSLW